MTMTYIFKITNSAMRISWKHLELAKMFKHDCYRGWYLPSNRTIASVVLRDLELNFQDQTNQVANLTIEKCGNENITIAIISKVRYFPL